MPLLTEINSFDYFLAEGGRGGGKSHAVARILLYIGEKRRVRIVCGRETQNTIQESVYTIMKDLIELYGLNYEVQSAKIIHRDSGTEITFRGFRQQGAFNIQGMEGIDILWIDEAQAITKITMDKLTPTIRKDKSKVFFTMNRHVANDPAFAFCYGDPACLHININYYENRFCTTKLLNDAAKCKRTSMEDYNHIWLGQPLEKTEDAVFGYDALLATGTDPYKLRQGYGLRLAAFDIARYGDDKCACVIIQQMGALHWEVFHVEQWAKKDLNHTTGKILQIFNEQKVTKMIIDEDGIGSGPLDTLKHGRQMDTVIGFRNPPIAYAVNKDFANVRTMNTYKLKDLVEAGHIAMADIELIKELCTLRYTFDHHQRKILLSKEKMRELKVKSPNMADALIMACSMIGTIKAEQARQYTPRNQQAPDCNLFNEAGVR